MLKFVFVVLCMFSASHCGAVEWKFDEVYREELVYLHTMVNYDFDPDWKQSWEKELMKGKGARFNFGSVSAKKLLHHEDVVINHSLGEGWWFRTNISWDYSRYKDIDETARYLEFQKEFLHNLSAGISADVKASKEEIDGTFSLLHVSNTRESYYQLHFCWDDLVYDKRNHIGGKTERQPFGIKWLSRFKGNKWILFTGGKLSTGFKRTYPDQNKSPDRTHHNQQINQAHGKLTWLLSKKSRIEAEISHYDYHESEVFRRSIDDYSYSNRIFHCAVRYIIPLEIFNWMDCEFHYVNQDASASGFKHYRYRRNEFIPAISVKRSFSKHMVKIGYSSSFYDWDYEEHSTVNDYERNDYIDKINLGWMYNFNKQTGILLSVSHVVRLESFGGGNVQYMMMF